ncbi:unnamed protein product [Moneuplotes crassus]|uniref:Uncharacterized protein n=1 Tax=Euplotes crassus TaxID=5936 RepID=A0AAD1Y3Z5_EUPCR|nr:unnamed protein product [Moneuplotes crassus]
MNAQKRFDDLYQYLNANNKTKTVSMARTGKTRNMLTLSRKNEKYTRMQCRLKPIQEINEPESDYLMNNNNDNSKIAKNFRKFQKSSKILNRSLKRTDGGKTIDPNYKMIRDQRKLNSSTSKKNNIKKQIPDKHGRERVNPKKMENTLKPPKSHQPFFDRGPKSRQERSDSYFVKIQKPGDDPRILTPSLKELPPSLAKRRNAIKSDFNKISLMGSTVKKENEKPRIIHSTLLNQDDSFDLSDLDRSYLENESLGTLEREIPQDMTESKFLGEIPDSSPPQKAQDSSNKEGFSNSKRLKRLPIIAAPKTQISKPKKFNKQETKDIQELEKNRKKIIMLDHQKRYDNSEPHALRRLRVIHKSMDNSCHDTFVRNPERMLSENIKISTMEESKLHLTVDADEAGSFVSQSSALQNSIETEEIPMNESYSSLNTIIEANDIPYSFMSKPTVQPTKSKKSIKVYPKKKTNKLNSKEKFGEKSAKPERIKIQSKKLTRKIDKFVNDNQDSKYQHLFQKASSGIFE